MDHRGYVKVLGGHRPSTVWAEQITMVGFKRFEAIATGIRFTGVRRTTAEEREAWGVEWVTEAPAEADAPEEKPHHPECCCNRCTYGAESRIGSEY